MRPMALRVHNVASIFSQQSSVKADCRSSVRPWDPQSIAHGPATPPSLTVCICQQQRLCSRPGSGARGQQNLLVNDTQQPGCMWPQCMLPNLDCSSTSGGRHFSNGSSNDAHYSSYAPRAVLPPVQAISRPQALTAEQLKYSSRQQQQPSLHQIQVLNKQEQQHEQELMQLQACAVLQQQVETWEQLQNDGQQRQQLQQPQHLPQHHSTCQLLQAIQSAHAYHDLARLVQRKSRQFKPHHTAAALLRLANIVTGQDYQAVAAAAATDASHDDSADHEQDWVNPRLASLDGASLSSMDGVSGAAVASLDSIQVSALTSGDSLGQASSSSSNGRRLQRSSSWPGLLDNSSNGNSKYHGLAGLISAAITGPESIITSSGSSSSAHLGSSSGPVNGSAARIADAAVASGLLDSVTMAARMERVRQQKQEQQQLRQHAWSAYPANMQQQQQQQGGASESNAAQQLKVSSSSGIQSEQVIYYDKLLHRLLQLVRSQAQHMSGSAGLSILTALQMLRYQPNVAVTKHLLYHPLWGGLSKLRPAGFTAVAARLASIKVQPDKRWLHRYFAVLQQQQLTSLSGVQLASIVVSLDALGWQEWPNGWPRQLSGLLAPQLGNMNGHELLLVAQALDCCCCTSDGPWAESFLASTRPHLASMPPSQLVRLLLALHTLRIKPSDAWLRTFFAACPARGLRGLAPAKWALLFVALSGLGLRPDGSWLRECYAACAQCLNRMDTQQLADVATAAARLGMSPPEPWVAALAASSMWQLACANPLQLAAIAEALVTVKAHPGDVWLQQYAAATDTAMLCCSGEELARLVAAAAALKHVPAAGWLARVEVASHDQLSAISPAGLSALAKAMQQLAAQPSLSWVYAFVSAAYRRLDQFDGGQLTGLFDALPALAPGPRWLDELVQICCYELPARQQQRLQLKQRPRQQQTSIQGVQQRQQEHDQSKQPTGTASKRWSQANVERELDAGQQQQQGSSSGKKIRRRPVTAKAASGA